MLQYLSTANKIKAQLHLWYSHSPRVASNQSLLE